MKTHFYQLKFKKNILFAVFLSFFSLLFAVDYQNKRIVCHKEIRPGSDEQKDLKEIMDYYRPFKGRHPEKFQVESI